jgi:hypothetical protein
MFPGIDAVSGWRPKPCPDARIIPSDIKFSVSQGATDVKRIWQRQSSSVLQQLVYTFSVCLHLHLHRTRCQITFGR